MAPDRVHMRRENEEMSVDHQVEPVTVETARFALCRVVDNLSFLRPCRAEVAGYVWIGRREFDACNPCS
jgi:hypothetical protein